MILVSGENLIDVFQNKFKKTYKNIRGGAGYNTAIALGRFNSKVYYFSNLSNDKFGKSIFKELKKNKIKTNFISKSSHLTAKAVVIGREKPKYNFKLQDSSFRFVKIKKISSANQNKLNLAYFTCLSLYLEPVASENLKLIKKIHKSTTIFIDPNIRTKIITSKKKYLKSFNNILNYTNIIKLSDEDLKYLSSYKDKKKLIYKWLSKKSLSAVILTKGKNGAKVYTNKLEVSNKPKIVKVKDTVGAGDTFSAGIIKYFEKNKKLNKKNLKFISEQDWLNALVFANSVASKTCERIGCDPPKINLV